MKRLSNPVCGPTPKAAYGAPAPIRNRILAALLLCLLPVTQALAEEITLLAFGDSLTQGYGLPEQDGFVPQLERWLEEEAGQGEVTVINGGVSGDTTAGGKARIAWSLTEEIDAVYVNLGANDMLRGMDPAATRANMEAIIAEITARGLPLMITHVPSASNYGPDYKAEFDAIFPALAEASGAIYHPNFLSGLGVADLQSAQPWMQGDGIHPNAEGVALIVADIGPRVAEVLQQVAK